MKYVHKRSHNEAVESGRYEYWLDTTSRPHVLQIYSGNEQHTFTAQEVIDLYALLHRHVEQIKYCAYQWEKEGGS